MFHFYRVIEGAPEYYCLLHTWKCVGSSNMSDIDCFIMFETGWSRQKSGQKCLCDRVFSAMFGIEAYLVMWLVAVVAGG
jgi:hypothetical protein